MAFFEVVVLSALHGFRKPNGKFLEKALTAVDLDPNEVVCVGNDVYRDVLGAHLPDIKTVLVTATARPRRTPKI
jgi:putative hydrolase of the HAD superfamily